MDSTEHHDPEIAGGDLVLGWDLGGVHVKVAAVAQGRLLAVTQAPYQLRQGLAVLDRAFAALPAWSRQARRHAVTMTGELSALFDDRATGVAALTDWATRHCQGEIAIYGGRTGFLPPHRAVAHAVDVASANWHATAAFVASRLPNALLVDIGSTTSDLIPIEEGSVAGLGYTDAERLASGELVYAGVVRTPLMSLADRLPFQGQDVTLVAEHFATIADVHRLLGTLPEEADQHDTADGRDKSLASTRTRLARVVGQDAGDAPDHVWSELAAHFAELQLRRLHDAAARILSRRKGEARPPLVGCGVGRFVAQALATRMGLAYHDLADLVPSSDGSKSYWASSCAPAVSLALLAAEQTVIPGERSEGRGSRS
ncbi:hydantoinase/oxoprolinase family protein [Labrys sp. KB_33_2]|uniref:hydantoinase/oxoprolinase family protein n=1 Tax=Labrys sp. KB_33_2 TaxID=3237479 RepID=UPI003F939EE1